MKTLLIVAILTMLTGSVSASDYNTAFQKTPPGMIEIKTIPASKLIKAQTKGGYFDGDNRLFGTLFRYISRNDVAMTTPVKADITPGAMSFYIGEGDLKKELKGTGDVTVIEEPSRTVASIGVRGAYTQKNFEEAKKKLLDYLGKAHEYKVVSTPYAVYWDSPFKLWFLKQFEVHIAVEKAEKK
jgi:effector-binding domain-containing protein